MTGTVRRVAPQPRGIVPDKIAARITDARQRQETSAADLDAAVVEALKAGGSIREVMKLAGWSSDRVQRVGRANGWPTAAQVEAREETKRRNAEWRAYIKDHPGGPPQG